MVEDNIHKASVRKQELYPWLVFAGSLLISLLGWSLELISQNLMFSFKAILEIHRSPVVWVLDLFPFIVLVTSLRFYRRNIGIKKERDQFLVQQEKIYDNYASFAEQLGRGDYENQLILPGENDRLAKSLKFLQRFLKASEKKKIDDNWVSRGKEKILRILRLYNEMNELVNAVLQNLCDYISMEQGALYLYDKESEILSCKAVYAYNRKKFIHQEFSLGHGLVGQCGYEMDFIYRTEIPEDYITISSGILGEQKPKSIVLIPLIAEEELQGVIEFAGIQPKVRNITIQFLLELGEVIGRAIYNLRMNSKTERLLEESRKMTRELQENESELRKNAETMRKTQLELERSNKLLESKVKEVEEARGKLHWMLKNASELISIYDENLHLSYVSPSVIKILGYTESEYKEGKDFERLTHKGSADLRKLITNAVSNPGKQQTIQYSFVKKEGDIVFLEATARNLINDSSINGIIINSIDITERMRAEKEERLKTRMQALSENSLDIIIRMSITGQFFYANPVVEDYLSLNPSHLINKNISELKFNQDIKEYFEETIVKQKSKPKKSNKEITILVGMGEKMTEKIIRFDAIPEINGGELETILFVGHDITETKRIEKELNEKNKKIEDSINYSKKIQNAILPDIDSLRRSFPRSFLLFKPRDVISGDFPWFIKTTDSIFIAAVDCTGHGVPGSMLSFIAYFLLKEVIKTGSGLNAGEICDLLHQRFRETLNQEGNRIDTSDGLDIALCKIHSGENKMDFAGAHRQLLFLRERELTEFKGNRKAIGGLELFKKADEKFINHTINFRSNDKIFLFTDGLTDQLGGPYGRKYGPARVMDLILENPGYTMKQYHSLFEEDFLEWMKGFRQLDDMLMIGIEF